MPTKRGNRVNGANEGGGRTCVPAPRDILGQCARDQGPAGCSQSHRRGEQTDPHGSLGGRREERKQRRGGDNEARGAEAGQAATEDKHRRIGGGTADSRASDEQQHRHGVVPPNRVAFIQLVE